MREATAGADLRRSCSPATAGSFPETRRTASPEHSLVLSEIIKPQVLKSGGNIIRWTGDEVLIEFDSVVEAVCFSAALREGVARFNQGVLAERRVALRVGINLDDVIIEDGDIFGDGVNIAARLKTLAKPGSVYVSEFVRDRVTGRVELDFEDLGLHNLKNIAQPVRVFRLGGEIVEEGPRRAAPGLATAASPGFDDRRAIAVLPFENFSSDPEQEFFADGITEDIITMLAGWRAFPVIARASTFTYKGKTVDVKKVGEELGVRYIVEGSVRKSGRRVRATAQLIQADTGHHLTAEKYDRDFTDLFELQDEIVTVIAGAIEPELLKFERERIAERPPRSENAYELYQRGLFHHYGQNKADNIEAQAYFRRALAIDAQYPQATAALSIALSASAQTGWADDANACFEDAYDLAQQAITLDPRYPNAALCSWSGVHVDGPFRARDRGVPRGDQGQPELCRRPRPAGTDVPLRRFAGRGDRAGGKGHPPQPQRSAPFHLASRAAGAHYQMRHYEQAIEIVRRSWTLNRNWPAGLRYVVAGLAELGRIGEAQDRSPSRDG